MLPIGMLCPNVVGWGLVAACINPTPSCGGAYSSKGLGLVAVGNGRLLTGEAAVGKAWAVPRVLIMVAAAAC